MNQKASPYLAFEFDALEHCAPLGAACGLREEQVCLSLLKLWRFCWRSKTDLITTTHITGFFYGTDASKALVAFGFIEANTTGWRVKGADRWLFVQRARSENGLKAAANGNLKRGKKSPVPLQQTPNKAPKVSSTPPAPLQHPLQHPSSTAGEPLQQSSNSAPALTASSEQRAANSELKDPAGKKQPAPHQATIDRLWSTYERERGSKYVPAPRDADFKAIKEMLAAGQTPDAIDSAWLRALRNVGFPAVSSVVELQAHYGKFSGAGPPRKGAIEPPTQHQDGQLAL